MSSARAPPPPQVSPTWEVTAATSRTAPHPAALVYRHRPGLQLVRLQGVSCEVTDLQLCEMVDEVIIGHPGRWKEERFTQAREGKIQGIIQPNKVPRRP